MEDSWPGVQRVGVISDTHMPRRGRSLPEALQHGLEGVDLILHAGDLVDPSVLEMLEQIAPVAAVCGNSDPLSVRMLLPERRVLQLGRFRVGLIHGHQGIGNSTPERARRAFTDVDAVVFGHSHIPYCEMKEGVLLFNPGSPTDRRREPHFSYGLLHIAEHLRGEICRFDASPRPIWG